MTKKQWLKQAEANKIKLINFVAAYHPRATAGKSNKMTITAPAAEQACEQVRRSIRKEVGFDFDPRLEIATAINNKDCEKIVNLLNSAWFGVPESTECWSIEGFTEAVELLEDDYRDDEDYDANVANSKN